MKRRQLISLLIVNKTISEIAGADGNPRLHSNRQIKLLAKSITAHGFLVPVLINGSGTIIAGHARVLAAKRVGLPEVPTICVEHLTQAQERAFRIADNRLTDLSTWDEHLLTATLKELADLELDFDLEATGFTTAEIDLKILELDAPVSGPDPADAVELPANARPVTRRGDLWILGSHRIVCSDAGVKNGYEAVLQGRHAAIVFTDPPYNVRIAGNVSGLGKITHREFAMASGEMSSAEFIAWLKSIMEHLVHHTCSGALHYIFMDWRHQFELLTAAEGLYGELKNLCVWVKDNAGMGSFYRSQHELIFVFKSGTTQHCNNIELGRFGRNRTNVWSYPGVTGFGRKGEEGNLLSLHPTVKPVQLIADALLDASARGDIVLDPFLGSGSTLIAAERVGRVCCGIEIDPTYIDAVIRRWQHHTGQSAIHAITEKTFDQMTVSRSGKHVGQ